MKYRHAVMPTSIGTDTANSVGTSITSGGSGGVFSAWTQLVASVDATAEGFYAHIYPLNAGYYQFEIGIGGAGSEVVIATVLSQGSCAGIYVPIRIPIGVRVSARVSAATGSSACRILLTLNRGRGITQMYGNSRAIGITSGVWTQADPGATANTKGAWVELVASTLYDVRAITLSYGTDNTGSTNAALMDLGVGASGSEQVVISNMSGPNTAFGAGNCLGLYNLPIPAGSRIAVRMQSSTNVTTGNQRQLRFAAVLWE
jgi:hypothetical protein